MLVSSLLMVALLFFRPAPDADESDLYPQRVIALSAGLTETVFATGGGGRLVGVSRWTWYPAQVGFIPRCGDILEPDYDRILALDPDLLMLPKGSETMAKFAEEHDIAVAFYSFESPQDVLRNVMLVGLELGNSAQAIALGNRIQTDLKRIRSRVPESERPKVALVLRRQPDAEERMVVAGGGGFVGKLLALVGAENVFADYEAFADVSYADLERLDPDVILAWQPGMTYVQEQAVLEQWAAQTSLRAVRNGKVRILSDDYLMIPGPRFTLAAYSLLRAVYGESVLRDE